MEFIQPISLELFQRKYMINGETSPDDAFRGVAKEIANAEKTEELKTFWENEFYQAMAAGKFIPGGRILANARPDTKLKQYNNCFVIPIEDSMEGIYEALRQDAVISGQGGGVGFNISTLRPKGAHISKGGTSSGAVSFLKIFNESAKVIMTAGLRRAAHIAIMNVDHPDIEEFITIKHGDSTKELTQFNLSVGITDKFINCVENDLDWNLSFKGKIYKTVKAKYLFDLIAINAFTHNEPGIFNLDHVNKNNTGYWAFDITACNPCAEEPLPAYGLCDLGAVNLSLFVNNPFENNCSIDFDELKKIIAITTRALDNVLDVTEYPLPEIKKMSMNWRRIGVGFTGLADMFAMMKIPYGSDESFVLSEKLAKFFLNTTYETSIDLAEEKGQFPSLDRQKFIDGHFVSSRLSNKLKQKILVNGIRNIATLTVAPTGTISLTVGNNCSSGIEPIFALQYNRNIRTGDNDETKKETVYDFAYLKYIDWQKNKDGNPALTEESKSYFPTSLDINPYKAIDIQSIFQKYNDSSISKTANLPNNYKFEDYKGLWLYAYKKGLKGFTSFNPNGSVKGILQYNDGIENSKSPEVSIERREASKRPSNLPCDIHVTSIKNVKFLILIGLLNGSIYETFITEMKDEWLSQISHSNNGVIRKNGKGDYDLFLNNGSETLFLKKISSNFNHDYEAPTRLLSTALRHGTPLHFIVEQLSKSSSFGSWGKSISLTLKKYIKDGEKVKSSVSCPTCNGSNLIYKEGCVSCQDCGWSKC